MKLRKVGLILVILAVPALLITYKITKNVVKAYAEYDASTVRDRGAAPEINSALWLNTNSPLHLSDFRGQVVLLDFWRINCPECVHATPYIQNMMEQYKNTGVQLISIHSPESAYEADVNNVRSFIDLEHVTFPVAIDNDQAIWREYQNTAWPTFLVIDRSGHILYRHVGEGRYEKIVAALNTALAQQ